MSKVTSSPEEETNLQLSSKSLPAFHASADTTRGLRANRYSGEAKCLGHPRTVEYLPESMNMTRVLPLHNAQNPRQPFYLALFISQQYTDAVYVFSVHPSTARKQESDFGQILDPPTLTQKYAVVVLSSIWL